MASSSRNDEESPLLPSTADHSQNQHVVRIKKVGHWIAEHAIVIFMALLIVAVVLILTIYFSILSPQKAETKSDICMTPACIHAASEILYNLSPNYKNIDPCTNFDELVCGGFSEHHDLRSDQGYLFTGTIMSENSQALLKHILEAPYPADSKHSGFSPAILATSKSSIDQQNFEKLKAAYDTCMDEATIKKEGVKPLVEIVNQVSDIFTAKTSSDDVDLTSVALSETLLYLAELGITPLVSVGAGADDKSPDTVVATVSAPWSLGLPAKDYYEDEKTLAKYEDSISEVLVALFSDSRRVNASNANAVVKFEKALAAASPDPEDANDITKSYHPMSLKDASQLTPQIQLDSILKHLAPANYKFERIIVGSPKYLKKLARELSGTPKDVLNTFFVWKVIQEFASVVQDDALKPYSRFRNELAGKDPESSPERWRSCIRHVDDGLGNILSRFFVEKAFSAKAKEFGDRIVSDIKDTFIEKLKVTSWMDKSVIKLAVKKVHQIVQKIGYPTKSPDIMDPPSLRQYYETLEIKSDFFKNNLEMSRFAVAKEWSALGRPVDREQWDMSAPTVDAYYNPPGNEIVFPAGIMQTPVFSVDLPAYLNYGAFGAVAGHELTHAFDSTGRHYDAKGVYTDWWTNSTVDAFVEKSGCFVDQYHNFTVQGPDGKQLNVNGKLTLGENLADVGGVSASFKAWQKRRAQKPNQDLPGLEFFTQEQMFFVNYANWWCDISRDATAAQRIYTDEHAPMKFRILGTMSNSRDFLESFSCPTKNPVCELW